MTIAAAGAALNPYAALLAALATHPCAALVVVADARASTPREAGATMIVTADGSLGTIGGGRLEYEALRIAREAIAAGTGAVSCVRFPLAAALGQCCGGVATLAFLPFTRADRDWIASVDAALLAGDELAVVVALPPGAPGRFVVTAGDAPGGPGAPGASETAIALARRHLAAVRAAAGAAIVEVSGGALLVHVPGRTMLDVCLFGNGHVGRALAQVLGVLPVRVRWIDAREYAFPEAPAGNVEIVATDVPEAELRTAPTGAAVVVTTHSHALDFELVAAALARADDWSYIGMIGSRAKRAQLARRLDARGLPPGAIDRVTCPMGVGPGLPRGKAPGTIAIAVAAQLLEQHERAAAAAAARPAAA